MGLALSLVLALAPASYAQVGTGSVYGVVTDESGGLLPGATVTLSGDFGVRDTVADSSGQYRFLNVDHGTHQLTVALPGFAAVSREVRVSIGVSMQIDFQLQVARG